MNLVLTIDPIPKKNWGKNLAHILPKEQWDVLRRNVYRQYNYRCGICGISAPLSCHEMWTFDDAKQVQKLVGLIALCENCHNIKHFGRVIGSTEYSPSNVVELINHFMKVNRCSREVFDEHNLEVARDMERYSLGRPAAET